MKKSPDQLSEDEVARRRDEVVKRMLATPPQPRAAKPSTATKQTKKRGQSK